MWCTDVQFFHLQFILHVSGWRAKDLILSVPLTIGSVPYQPPVLPTSVEPSAPPLSPPPYSEGQTYPGVGKWLSRQEFWIWQTVVFRWSLLSQSSYNSFIDLSFFSLQLFHRTQNVCMVGCLFVTRMIPTTWWVTQPSLQCIRLLAITRFLLLQAKTLLLWLLLNSHKPHLVKCLCLKFEHLYNFMHRITSQCLLFPLSYVKVLYVKFSNFFFIVTR